MKECQALALAPPPRTWDEHLPQWCRDGWDWRDFNLDRFWVFLQGGRASSDRIVAITNEAVTLASGTVVTRKQLGLPPIVEPVTLVMAGPPATIGQVIPD